MADDKKGSAADGAAKSDPPEEPAAPAAPPKVPMRILKPFRFSSLPPRNPDVPSESAAAKLPIERQFMPGDIELDPDDPMLSHPWIAKHYADGKIENPTQRVARLTEEANTLALKAAQAEKAKEQAEQATARLAAAQQIAQASGDEVQRELNTPVNELRTKNVTTGKAK